MSMSHFCRAWWARWGLGSLAGGKRYHFNPGYTTDRYIKSVDVDVVTVQAKRQQCRSTLC